MKRKKIKYVDLTQTELKKIKNNVKTSHTQLFWVDNGKKKQCPIARILITMVYFLFINMIVNQYKLGETGSDFRSNYNYH